MSCTRHERGPNAATPIESYPLNNAPTHFDSDGKAHMVDVSEKRPSVREATAAGEIVMSLSTAELIKSGDAKKGDVLGVARLAAIQSTKSTHLLIPLCHAIPVEAVTVKFNWLEIAEDDGTQGSGSEQREALLVCEVCVKTSAKTGVEMEAMMAASVGCLTVYDMVKAVERGIEVRNICLLEKKGGKTGDYLRV
ncbi:MAG: cyclic pyranopterin monophosphate synthase MoaC [Rubripirellula sp.]|nr:cyclic pyranopterin monophosphate synthase MoaC [Rubripirellula sp.]